MNGKYRVSSSVTLAEQTAALRYGGFMKKLLSLFLVFVIFTGICTVLSSCSAPEDGGAEIAVYLGDEIYDFDPNDYYVNSNVEQLMSLIYEPLFKVNKNGKLENAAAKKYDVNEEERTIVIELRETYWSDEVRVKAEDYVYAWRNRILDPNRANPAAALFYDIENAVEVKMGEKSIYDFGAVASDIYEITITYRDGADYKQLLKNLASVASSPAREDIVNTAEAYWTKITSTIVTNGPFRIEELDVDMKAFSLGRNLGYHQKSTATNYTKNVTPAKLVSFTDGVGSEFSVSYADIAEKTVFYMLDASLEDRQNNKTAANVADDLSTYSYVFNTENELFKIPEVRKALSLALDRVAMANAQVFAKPAESFVSAPIAEKLYSSVSRPLSQEQKMDTAKELIKSVSSKLNGLSLSFTLTVNNDEESIAVANLAKNAWRELGFTVNVKPVGTVKTTIWDESTSENIEIYDSEIQYLIKDASYGIRNFDVIAVDWQMYSDDAFVALAAFTSSMNGCGVDFSSNTSRTNVSGWHNSDYDAYINAAYTATTAAERDEALRNAEKLLVESSPIIPVLYNRSFSFGSEDISGVEIDGMGNFVFNKAEQKDYQQYLPDNKKDEETEEE